MLISTLAYAEKHGYKYSTVASWIKKGLMPDAQKKPIGTKGTAYMYVLPDDSPPPEIRLTGRPRTVFGEKQDPVSLPNKAKPKTPRKRTQREISLFIRRHCGTKTIKEIACALDISALEVRAVYDRLHDRYGI